RPAWADTVITGTNGVTMAFGDDPLDQCAPLKVWIAGKGERTLAKPRKCNEEHAGTWQPGPGIVVVNAPSPEVRDAVANAALFKLDFGPRPLAAARISSDGKRLLLVLGPGARLRRVRREGAAQRHAPRGLVDPGQEDARLAARRAGRRHRRGPRQDRRPRLPRLGR